MLDIGGIRVYTPKIMRIGQGQGVENGDDARQRFI